MSAIKIQEFNEENVKHLPIWIFSLEEIYGRINDSFIIYFSHKINKHKAGKWPIYTIENALKLAIQSFQNKAKVVYVRDVDFGNYGWDQSTIAEYLCFLYHPLMALTDSTPTELIRQLVDKIPLHNIETVLRLVKDVNSTILVSKTSGVFNQFTRLDVHHINIDTSAKVQILDTVSYLIKVGAFRIVNQIFEMKLYRQVWWSNPAEREGLSRQLVYWSAAIRNCKETDFTLQFIRDAVSILLYAMRMTDNLRMHRLLTRLKYHSTYLTIDKGRRHTIEHFLENLNLGASLELPTIEISEKAGCAQGEELEINKTYEEKNEMATIASMSNISITRDNIETMVQVLGKMKRETNVDMSDVAELASRAIELKNDEKLKDIHGIRGSQLVLESKVAKGRGYRSPTSKIQGIFDKTNQ